MKKKEIINFFMWIILLIPFFKTDYMARYGIVNNIMNIWRLASILGAIILFLKRGKLSKKIVILMVFLGWITIITILNNGNIQLCTLFAMSIIAMAIIFENRDGRY